MSTGQKPAKVGGVPAFDRIIPITQPTLPPFEALEEEISRVFSSNILTNGPAVRTFEARVAEAVKVRHAVAVSSCTAGLMLVLQAYELKGKVLLPSFTFSASGHVVLWNGLEPRFVDIDPQTFVMSSDEVEHAIDRDTAAVLGVHIFGNPAEPERLESITRRRGIKLIFDAAHALGSVHRGRPIGGFGDAEVFSLSPTKLVVAGEGGVVTTNDDELARRLRVGRDYGNPGTYDCEFAGLNARMTEVNAIVAAKTLDNLSENIQRRHGIATLYKARLERCRGVGFQQILPGSRTTYKDFAISIHEAEFGLSRDTLADCLEAEHITTRRYFYPPLHEQKAYRAFRDTYRGRLPVTERISREVLCLPMFSHMEDAMVGGICDAIDNLVDYHAQIAALPK